MHIRDVGMLVAQARVPVPMGMRLAGRVARRMLVLMVRIMDVRMGVLHRLVLVRVLVLADERVPTGRHVDTVFAAGQALPAGARR